MLSSCARQRSEEGMMETIATELTHDEQAGQLAWTDSHGNLRVTEGIFWLAFSVLPTVAWKSRNEARPERFCSLDDVCKFKPRA